MIFFLIQFLNIPVNLLVRQVFPHLDFMGWYTIGVAPTELDLKIHDQVFIYII